MVTIWLITGIILMPLSLPLLQPANYVKYESFLGLSPPKMENHKPGKMPQHFAGMFGWVDTANVTRKIYDSLSKSEQKNTVIMASNYGFAGSLQFHGFADRKKIVGSSHNHYYLWGPPQPLVKPDNPENLVVISVGYPAQQLKRYFGSVTLASKNQCDNCLAYRQQTDIYICKNPVKSIKNIWPELKKYI